MNTPQTVDVKHVPEFNPGDRILFENTLSGCIVSMIDADICIVRFDAINGCYPVSTAAISLEMK